MKTAAFLLYAGYAVKAVEKQDRKIYFVFEDSPARHAALLAFWNREQRVEPVAFLDSLNMARDIVTQALKS